MEVSVTKNNKFIIINVDLDKTQNAVNGRVICKAKI